MRFMKRFQVVALLCGLATVGARLEAAPAAGHAHAHPTEGPHHGALIELGKEDYHAELVHEDATDTVTIYILDSSATKPVPIAAKQLTLNMRAENKDRLKALELLLKYTIPRDWDKQQGPEAAQETRVLDGVILSPQVLEILNHAVRTHKEAMAAEPVQDASGRFLSTNSHPLPEPAGDAAPCAEGAPKA